MLNELPPGALALLAVKAFGILALIGYMFTQVGKDGK